ncbi:MAG: Xaa-Pro peptidase family protein [Oscillospiraceae bacterium]|jgi:Xaa-Pro aminopeptidase|nr:Xaa-Pro peptidase family protein [Oscillospiraceae bacterium]
MNFIEKLQKNVAEAEFDALLITSDINRRYATGFPSSAGVAIIAADGAWFFTDTRYFEAASAAIPNAEVRLTNRENPYAKLINDVCAERGYTTLGFEEERVTFKEHANFAEKLTATLVPAQKFLTDARAVKTAEELDKMIAAQRIAEKSFNDILSKISTKITERELANELFFAFLRNGADDKSFATIAVSGPRSSMPHGVPTDEKISEGFLTLDFGVIKDGYCSDTTRTVCIGRATDEMRLVYDTVIAAQLAGIAAAKAGVRGCDIHAAAHNVIANAGFGEYFGHGFGHSLGLEIHENPNASPTNTGEIPAGAVISAEPGIYLPGRFGVRIEDVIYITEDGCVNITELPKELMEIY